MPTVEEAAGKILQTLYSLGRGKVSGHDLAKATGLAPEDINDAVDILESAGHVEWLRSIGTAPYTFYTIGLTARGRYEVERLREAPKPTTAETQRDNPARISRPPTPVGSPFGFTDQDWEHVALRKAEIGKLNVILGYQFESQYYDTGLLVSNIRNMMDLTVNSFNERNPALKVQLAFTPLSAGYGEHLFNEIARDIIASDIAIFETSDRNANVMIEVGVALTWGIRVLPIREVGSPKPPSDISGQTYAEHRESGSIFPDAQHAEKMEKMVGRAVQRKSAH